MSDLLTRGSAVFSPCGTYRYTLKRNWFLPGTPQRLCAFIMLNPSTADAEADDPTTRRCMAFARELGCDRYAAVNLFAFRSPSPAAMLAARDPIGPENDIWIRTIAHHARRTGGYVICGWGVHGKYRGRDNAVLRLIGEEGVAAHRLRATKDGHPEHPLYIRAPWRLEPFGTGAP